MHDELVPKAEKFKSVMNIMKDHMNLFKDKFKKKSLEEIEDKEKQDNIDLLKSKGVTP